MTRHEPLWRRYGRLVRRDIVRDVDDELAFHLAMRAAEYVAAGMDPAEARRMAHERFGRVKDSRDACLAVDRRLERRDRRSRFLEELGQDARYGLRTLWQHRAFSTAVVASPMTEQKYQRRAMSRMPPAEVSRHQLRANPI